VHLLGPTSSTHELRASKSRQNFLLPTAPAPRGVPRGWAVFPLAHAPRERGGFLGERRQRKLGQGLNPFTLPEIDMFASALPNLTSPVLQQHRLRRDSHTRRCDRQQCARSVTTEQLGHDDPRRSISGLRPPNHVARPRLPDHQNIHQMLPSLHPSHQPVVCARKKSARMSCSVRPSGGRGKRGVIKAS
jgi:hypothetical protein